MLSVTVCAKMNNVKWLISRLPRRCMTTVTGSSPQVQKPLNFVNGERSNPVDRSNTEALSLIAPATGEELRVVESSGKDEVDNAVQCAKLAFKSWSKLSGNERGSILKKAASIVRARSEELARTEVLDTGKPIWEARWDILGCADTIDYYGGLAATISGDYLQLSNGSFSYTVREPLGVVGGIGAWNYPFQMASWKSSPALACGNTIVFKPSPLTPLTAVMLGEIYSEAGLPNGAYNVIQGDIDTGRYLNVHPDIAKMSFTGSVAVGSKIMETCAKDIKHVTLELGGKSPCIIFEDADLDNAVSGAMLANFLTQGQGADILCGGKQVTPQDKKLAGGIYISPCILVNCEDDMRVVREEIFGSVMCVLGFETEDEVLRRANDTEFGLAGGVFTKDLQRAHRVASSLEAGSLYVNNYNVYPVGVPFGGYKKSGIGRENGPDAIEYYTQIKSVYVEMGDIDAPF
ncbi:hypothetical protein KUTeg_008931 [Tegillarca granosa]|uniref:Aldehyde dehydrogenase domain-containing protein n=1 Tax=Tegillarca granosa TaxID=220873 RepID=A0ABQ9FFC4_TEGGR|nr:hypothetical protein KUTeg_008931 [Tegillarca granosa]